MAGASQRGPTDPERNPVVTKDGGLPLAPGQQQGPTGATSGKPGGAVSAAAPKGPAIQIDPPQDAVKTADGGALFSITAAPAMPLIHATASIVGVTPGPDPTPTTEFEWTATVSFDSKNCPHGVATQSKLHHKGETRTIPEITAKGKVTGGRIVVNFSKIRGGTLTLKVTAKMGGLTLTCETKGWRIQGTNPSKGDVGAAMPNDACRKIACLESGMQQFTAAPKEGNAMFPYFSGDNLLGIGISQLTTPPPADDEVWNWRENVKAGIHLYNQKKSAARAYPKQVAKSKHFLELVKSYNDNLNKAPAAAAGAALAGGPPKPAQPAPAPVPPVSVIVPEFTAEQLEDDTIRAFNGWAGNDGFIAKPFTQLHEFRIQQDPVTKDLVVDGDPKTGKVYAKWARVPVADRPQVGDPDYVNDVKMRDPGTCAKH